MAGASRGNRQGVGRTDSAGTYLESLRSAVADLLLPMCCAACGRLLMSGEKGIVCGHCWSLVRELPNPRCNRCGHPVDTHQCRWCPQLPAFVRAARSYCWIGAGTGKAIIHALKYDGWTAVADGIAERMARVSWPRDVTEERSALIPVPLSNSRRRERGFNQSAVIAEKLGALWKVPVWEGCLVRGVSSQSQTHLTPGERLTNVAGAFSIPHASSATLRGAHIVLVDDVVTTGATLRACASALFASGARTISYMTFGRAPASGDRLTP